MAGQMKAFWDSTGFLWASNALVGKIGSVFSSSNTQHGGQESTILSTHIVLLHQGFLIAGLPYTNTAMIGVEEVKGGSPYGASTIAGPDGSRQPTVSDLESARFQGKFATEMGRRMTTKWPMHRRTYDIFSVQKVSQLKRGSSIECNPLTSFFFIPPVFCSMRAWAYLPMLAAHLDPQVSLFREEVCSNRHQ